MIRNFNLDAQAMKAIFAFVAAMLVAVPAAAQDDAVETEARQALAEFAECIARTAPGESDRVLRMDFTTAVYRRALADLSRGEEDRCFNRFDTMRAGNLLVAGSLAEHLLARDPAALSRNLVQVAQAAAIEPHSASDRIAVCTLRSMPDETATLFTTALGSDAETASYVNLMRVAELCRQAAELDREFYANPAGLRAMLATAAYRSIAALEEEG